MQKDSFGYKITIINAIFLFVISLANFNTLDLTIPYNVFMYVVPNAVCNLLSIIIFLHILKDGKNIKNGFIIAFKWSLGVQIGIVTFILLLFIAYLIKFISLQMSVDNNSVLYFSTANVGNISFISPLFITKFSTYHYALLQPLLYFTNIIYSGFELANYNSIKNKSSAEN